MGKIELLERHQQLLMWMSELGLKLV